MYRIFSIIIAISFISQAQPGGHMLKQSKLRYGKNIECLFSLIKAGCFGISSTGIMSEGTFIGRVIPPFGIRYKALSKKLTDGACQYGVSDRKNPDLLLTSSFRSLNMFSLNKPTELITHIPDVSHFSYEYIASWIVDGQNGIVASLIWTGPGEKARDHIVIENIKENRLLYDKQLVGSTASHVFTSDKLYFREAKDPTDLSNESYENPVWKCLNLTKRTLISDYLTTYLNGAENGRVIYRLAILNEQQFVCQLAENDQVQLRFYDLKKNISKIINFSPNLEYELDDKCFQASPSGKWLHFQTYYVGDSPVHKEQPQHFLVYFDPSSPDGFYPPIELKAKGLSKHIAWTMQPESLVLAIGKHIYHWDLSKFDPKEYFGK